MTSMRNIFGVALAMTLMAGCGGKSKRNASADESGIVEYHENVPGDSTLYGLACDGCTDSAVVILPYSGGQPDTFDIVRATRNGKIHGQPRVGSRLALTMNPKRRHEASQVIVLNDLEQQWCFSVMPQIIGDQPDSVVEKLMVPHEYSYAIKPDNQLRTIGNIYHTGTSDEQSPVEYPAIRQYNKWSTFNGKLILSFDAENAITAENDSLQQHIDMVSDTAEIMLLNSDTLVLRINGKKQGFYRK